MTGLHRQLKAYTDSLQANTDGSWTDADSQQAYTDSSNAYTDSSQAFTETRQRRILNNEHTTGSAQSALSCQELWARDVSDKMIITVCEVFNEIKWQTASAPTTSLPLF